jgi:lysophospholipase L1-like esterase
VGLPALRQGSRVVFLGDSITEQHLFTLDLETLLLCRHPQLRLRCYNRGLGGERAADGLERFDRDVAPLAPALVFLQFGMNDGGYRPLLPRLADEFRHGLTGLVRRARSIGAEPVLLSPGCVDPDRKPELFGYNVTLESLTDICREVSEAEGAPFADLFAPLLAGVMADPTSPLLPDGVHPGPEGQRIMATAAAEQLGLIDEASWPPLPDQVRELSRAIWRKEQLLWRAQALFGAGESHHAEAAAAAGREATALEVERETLLQSFTA